MACAQLFGGPQGFMISTNVAETDADHATTLYRFLRHLIANLQHVSSLPADCAFRPCCCFCRLGQTWKPG